MTTSSVYQSPTAATQTTNALSISSLVLGLASIFAGWTFVAPIAGLVVGILALQREPEGRTLAIWGIVLNGVILAGAVLSVVLMLAFGLALLPFLPLAFI